MIAITAHLGLPAEHPMIGICRAAIGAVLSTYLGEIVGHGLDADLHQSVLTFLGALLDAAASG